MYRYEVWMNIGLTHFIMLLIMVILVPLNFLLQTGRIFMQKMLWGRHLFFGLYQNLKILKLL